MVLGRGAESGPPAWSSTAGVEAATAALPIRRTMTDTGGIAAHSGTWITCCSVVFPGWSRRSAIRSDYRLIAGMPVVCVRIRAVMLRLAFPSQNGDLSGDLRMALQVLVQRPRLR